MVCDTATQSIERQGFALAPSCLAGEQVESILRQLQAAEASDHARKRGNETYAIRNILKSVPGIYEVALNPQIFETIKAVLGEAARPVKAILFDKTPGVNWNLRWHQDNVIAVQERKDVQGFTAWSERVGIPHVRPPVEVLEDMLAARIHLDDCLEDNGALQVIPGSHSRGRLSDEEVKHWKSERQIVTCEAKVGDVLYMRPLLLHSSRPSINPLHRRVLHIEYAGSDLPGGLMWGE